ncbi:MAG: signal peptidase I [Acidobacteriia bacterium]|nr:signal peptidase I [Terriglobia bacterium]
MKPVHILQRARPWLRDLVIAIGLAAVVVVFLYQPVRVEGVSMLPRIHDQERLFINKFVYRLRHIERGDVIVFWYPLDPHRSFIKRVIGLPGERVEIRQGIVYVNDRPLPERYVSKIFQCSDNEPPLMVAPGHYYVLGDHRNSSNDSRTWGLVPQEDIYGKATLSYWPLDKFGWIQ